MRNNKYLKREGQPRLKAPCKYNFAIALLSLAGERKYTATVRGRYISLWLAPEHELGFALIKVEPRNFPPFKIGRSFFMFIGF